MLIAEGNISGTRNHGNESSPFGRSASCTSVWLVAPWRLLVRVFSLATEDISTSSHLCSRFIKGFSLRTAFEKKLISFGKPLIPKGKPS
jgi:hypothetical protein